MSAIEDAIQNASRRPLYDAAYNLWSMHHELNWLEVPNQSTEMRGDMFGSPAKFRTQVLPIVRRVVAQIRFEGDNARDGATFGKLKKAHPECEPNELKAAIDAALKLQRDSDSNFVYTGKLVEDAFRAASLARENNPGFTDEIYRKESTRLCIQNR